MESVTSITFQSPPPLPPKTSPRSSKPSPASLISINTNIHDESNNCSISLPHQITSKSSSTVTTTSTLTQVVQVSPSPTLPQTNGNINVIKTTSSNAVGATVFVESRRTNNNDEDKSTIDQQLINNNNQLSNNHVVKILINPTKNNNDIINNNKNNKSIVTLIKDQQTEELTINNNYNKQNFNSSVLINVNNNNNNNNIENTEDEVDMIKNTTMKSTDLTTFQNKSQQQQTATTNVTNNMLNNQGNPYFFYTGFQCSPTNLIMSSGQCSPSDTLDSGTCSDLDMTPPPLPKKKNSKTSLNSSTTSTVLITTTINKKNNNSGGMDSSAEECEDTESNVSCDSLNSSDLLIMNNRKNSFQELQSSSNQSTTILPRNLLQDIREHRNNVKNTQSDVEKEDVTPTIINPPPIVASVLEKSNSTSTSKVLINESTYEDRKKQKQDEINNSAENSNTVVSGKYLYDADRFYKFHLNENVLPNSDTHVTSKVQSSVTDSIDDDECFAGYKDLLGGEVASTIRSAKGTVRGVKNRVRAGIATFLQIQQTSTKSYREKDAGKVVVYSTTMGIVRNTYHQCLKVKQILRTHMVKFEERDVFMSNEYQSEIRDRMQSEHILIPQVYVDGQYIGDAETVDRLNECGELRRILKPYKSADACSTCQVCGGYRLLPCPVCNGSKKSVHRNHFTTEFVALKCMNCDEVGLVRCYSC